MNPLMHATFAIKLLEHAKIKTAQPELILGTVLPDLCILGIIPEYDAHKRGLEFLDYLSHNEPSLTPLGVGWVLHGEEPECLDYHVHKPNGYIDCKKQKVIELARQKNITFEGIHQELLAHTLIEFTCDSLAEKSVVKQLHQALRKADLEKISFHIATFFKGDQKRILRVIKFFKYFNFNKLRTMHGIAHTFQDFMIIHQNFAHGESKKKGWMKAYKFIWARINAFKTHRLVQLLKEVRDVVGEDCHSFLEQSKSKVYTNVIKNMLGEHL